MIYDNVFPCVHIFRNMMSFTKCSVPQNTRPCRFRSIWTHRDTSLVRNVQHTPRNLSRWHVLSAANSFVMTAIYNQIAIQSVNYFPMLLPITYLVAFTFISTFHIPFRMKQYTEFNLETWLKLVKFTVLYISEFWFLKFNYINYHWEISPNVI